MEKRVTIVDVAKNAQVSTASVSRYLKDPTSVRPILAVRIKESIDELHYEPNINARNLRSKKTNIIGVIIPHFEYFFDDICTVINDYFFTRNYITYICQTNNDGLKEKKYVQQLLAQNVDGLILAPSGQNTMFFRNLAKSYTNVVAIDREENIGWDIVLENHKKNAFDLVSWEIKNYTFDYVLLLFGFKGSFSTQKCVEGSEAAIDTCEVNHNQIKYCFTNRNPQIIQEEIQKVSEVIGKEGNALIIAFSSDILEYICLEINRNYRDILERVHISGFAQKDIAKKIGDQYSYVIKRPKLLGVTASELLLKKIEKRDNSQDSVYFIETEKKFVKG